MTTGIPDSLERLSHTDLIGVVRELIGEVGRLRTENEKLSGALTKLKVEHQAVKDELARLKNLPPRPPQKPSGMDKATDDRPGIAAELTQKLADGRINLRGFSASVIGTQFLAYVAVDPLDDANKVIEILEKA